MFGPRELYLLQKTILFLLLVFFVFLMRGCCRDVFKTSLKDFSTFLSLCPLPVKLALYFFDLLLYSSSVGKIMCNLKATSFCIPKIEGKWLVNISGCQLVYCKL